MDSSAETLQELIRAKIENLRPKLLDLSRRNSLISTKLGPRSNSHIRAVDELPDVLYFKIRNSQEMQLVPLPSIEDDPRDELTDAFREALINARLTDETYLTEMEGIDKDADDYLDRSREVERALRDRVREIIGLAPRVQKATLNLVQHARNNGVSPSYELPTPQRQSDDGRHTDDNIQTLLLPSDLERKLNSILSKCRTWIQETGMNVLHVAFGFLEWSDGVQTESSFAPLILLQSEIRKRRTAEGITFAVAGTGEEPELNTVLAEKLRIEFGIELPSFDGSSIESYLQVVAEVAPKKLTWRVRRQVAIGVFPSARMAMYHDIDPTQPTFSTNAIVQTLLTGGNSEAASPFADEYEVDHPNIESKVPYLVMDADSSQFSALVDVAQGKNLAIEGPPGTGKSQTIVNMIAGALGAGKRVLFVAEKLAALNVVKSRLESVGLGEFLLPLLAEKSTREQVIGSIRERLEMENTRSARGYDEKVRRFREVREKVAGYIELISSPYAQSELTVHEILGKSISSTPLLANVSNEILRRSTINAQFLSSSGLVTLHSIGEQLEAVHAQSADAKPIWRETGLRNPDRFTVDDVCALCGNASDRLGELADARAALDIANLPTASTELLQWTVDCLERSVSLSALVGSRLLAELIDHKLIRELETFAARAKNVLEERSRLATFLSAEPSAETLNLAMKTSEICRRYDVMTISRRELAEELETRRSSGQTSKQVAAKLEPLVDSVPASKAWTISEISVASSLIASAGRDVLALRNIRNGDPNSLHQLISFCEEGLELRELKAELSDRLSVSNDISTDQLEASAAALRRSGFFARFSREYRDAKRLFLSISLDQKFSNSEAIRLFHRLIDLRHKEREFTQMCRTSACFGANFRGLNTRFDLFLALARFYRSCDAQFSGNASLREFLRTGDLSALDLLPSFPSTNLTLDYEALCKRSAEALARGDQLEQALEELSSCPPFLRNQDASLTEVENVRDQLQQFLKSNSILDDSISVRAILGEHFSALRERPDQLEDLVKWSSNATKHAHVIVLLLSNADVDRSIAAIRMVLRLEDKARTAVDELRVLSRTNIELLTEGLSLREAATKLKEAASDRDGLFVHAAFAGAVDEVRPHGVLPLVEARMDTDHHLKGVGRQFEALAARQLAQSVYRDHGKELARYPGVTLDELRANLAKHDKELIQLSRQQLRSSIQSAAKPPQGNGIGRKSTWTNMALIENEVSKKQRYIPVRDLTQRAGEALLELKPCWMMSPLAVAQYIPKGSLKFDLCIIDEASQMPPEAAIGALLRCDQVVVVGDTNQLPPSNFFKTLIDDDDTDEDESVLSESVLEMANASFRPARQLRWHYRSRHSGLIKFSNRLVYDDNLVVFPSPTETMKQMGVEYRRIDGRYKAGTNPIEARSIIDATLDFMRNDPNRSLGVVTLNQKQRDLINEEFEYAITNDRHAQRYVEAWRERNDGLEEFFIKNLENVQGDERDVIFIGTVYGPEEPGARVMQRFGPINGLAGRRRLNVLFTRAKQKIVTFSSMTAADIEADETSNPGTYMLKRWLEYSATGVLDSGDITLREPDSDFEIFVINQIKSMGCIPIPQVGVAGYFIDIGIRHPEWAHGFILGVECDGAAYHSAKSARDRDRLRQEVLENLGWKLHRIWSTDWFNNPQREAERLRKTIAERMQFLKGKESEFKTPTRTEPTEAVSPSAEEASSKIVLEQERKPEEPTIGVSVGDRVRIRYLTDDKKTMQFTISRHKSDASTGLVSEHSPIAQALLGSEQGEEVEVLIGSYIRRAIVESIEKGTTGIAK